jgi:hypothetical protein
MGIGYVPTQPHANSGTLGNMLLSEDETDAWASPFVARIANVKNTIESGSSTTAMPLSTTQESGFYSERPPSTAGSTLSRATQPFTPIKLRAGEWAPSAVVDLNLYKY